jgi:hypothetical protein
VNVVVDPPAEKSVAKSEFPMTANCAPDCDVVADVVVTEVCVVGSVVVTVVVSVVATVVVETEICVTATVETCEIVVV